MGTPVLLSLGQSFAVGLTCRVGEGLVGSLSVPSLLALQRLDGRPITLLMWLPMLAFAVPPALWLIFKGVAARAT